MSASQNKKKTLSLGLALIPVISMLLLLIIGYGIMGLRILMDLISPCSHKAQKVSWPMFRAC